MCPLTGLQVSPQERRKAGEGDKHCASPRPSLTCALKRCGTLREWQTGTTHYKSEGRIQMYKARVVMTLTDWQQEKKKSGIQLNLCTIQGQLFILGIWLLKANKGELALDSSINQINGRRQHQSRRDSSWWNRLGGRRIQSSTLKSLQWPSRVKGLTGWT